MTAPRPPLADRLATCYSGAIYDVLREVGRRDTVLPSTIRPLNPEDRLAGPVFTVSGKPGSDLDPHETLLAWTGLLSKAPRGTIVVCQPNDSSLAHMGELSAETLKMRGIRGYLVDGGCRDTEFIVNIGFPVWCRYNTPADVVGRWLPTGFGEPVEIGQVPICTDDYIIADRDGAVVIPANLVPEVIDKAEALMGTESLVRKAIREGVDPQEAYLRFGAF